MEQFANNAGSVLNGGINNSVTSLVVSSAASFPATGIFSILIDSEIMTVSAVSGTTFTVVRGAEGTTAASHSNGASVDMIETARSMSQYRADSIQKGTFSGLPAAGNNGVLYKCTDASYEFRDNGASWDAWVDKDPVVLPPTGVWSWVNQNGAAIDESKGSLFLTVPQNSADSWSFRVKTLPATPYHIYVKLEPTLLIRNFTGVGIILRKSSDGTWIGFEQYSNTGQLFVTVGHGTNTGPAITADDLGSTGAAPGFYPWMRISDDGTNRTYYVSQNGRNWLQIYSQAHATPLVPDTIGFGGESRNATYGLNLDILSWQES